MIKEKRNSFGYTQKKMANMLNISLRQYVRIDKEECFPRGDILKKLIYTLSLTDEEVGKYVNEFLNKNVS